MKVIANIAFENGDYYVNGEKIQLIQFLSKKGQNIACFVAFKDSEGKVKKGFSKCHIGLDKFDKVRGLEVACGKALTGDEYEVSYSLRSDWVRFEDRVKRYFKIGKKKLYNSSTGEIVGTKKKVAKKTTVKGTTVILPLKKSVKKVSV